VGTTPVKVTTYNIGSGSTYTTSTSATGGLIHISETGYYDLHMTTCFSGSANQVMRGYFRVAGVEQDEGWHRYLGGTDVGAAHAHACGKYITAGQTVSFYVECGNDSKSLTISDAVLSVRRIR